MSTAKTSEGLQRLVGVPGLALTIINFTIGAGFLVLPAVVGIQMVAFGIVSCTFCAIMLKATNKYLLQEIGHK